MEWIALRLPVATDNPAKQITKVSSNKRNRLSVCAQILIGNDAILLGGDMEEQPTNPASFGWSAILANTGKPPGSSTAFKIPHHGSSNGHVDAVWSEMLVQNPLAVLAPWTLAGGVLPTEEDVSRILTFTDHAFSTARLGTVNPTKKDRAVTELADATTLKRSKIHKTPGAVRARKKAGSADPWIIELFGGATSLDKLYP
ncbi:MAG: hypothetical protein WDN76_06220 [Alphaproteobacteria bacterium]